MNANATVHLVWKEYRAVRAFWLAMIVLAVLLEWFVVAIYAESSFKSSIIYGLALGVPAFFALGCAGTAFAVEREEGTLEFLRGSPTSSREVLVSKLLVIVLATALMGGLLWSLALGLRHQPAAEDMRDIVGLWLVAAVEAIAWGTLCSMLSARPLAAVVMGLVAASVSVHLIVAWSVPAPVHWMELAPYRAAALERLVVAAVVLAIDIAFGLRWLQGIDTLGDRLRQALSRRGVTLVLPSEHESCDLVALRTQPDRGAVLGHLLWQTIRQSWKLLTLMGIVLTLTTIMASVPEAPRQLYGFSAALVVVAPVAALAGAFVFLPDQERRQYRYFVEHNVPPRDMWRSRQLVWGATVFGATALGVLVGGFWAWARLWHIVGLVADPMNASFSPYVSVGYLRVPAVLSTFVFVALSYTVGQWCSIMIRSGVLAGFAAVVLSGCLGFWCTLMASWHVSWWWSVMPIPLLLLAASSLRTTDWIRENTSWSARVQAARNVLLPAAVLCVAMPWYRVHEVPVVHPDFDPDGFMNVQAPEALATGAIYRQASELYAKQESKQEVLAVVLEASRRPECLLDDPRTATSRPWLADAARLCLMVADDADRLERAGKLDEALDRRLQLIHVEAAVLNESLLYNAVHSFLTDRTAQVGLHSAFRAITTGGWAENPAQTPETLRAGIRKLAALDRNLLGLETTLKSNYVVTRRYVLGDATAWEAMFRFDRNNPKFAPNVLWPIVTPWEEYRGLRELNVQMAVAGERLEEANHRLQAGREIASMLPQLPRGTTIWNSTPDWTRDAVLRRQRPAWLAALSPDLSGMHDLSTSAVFLVAEFEARRRAAMLQLALAAFQLEHGALPRSLDELRDDYLMGVPLDPYSGDEFRYFPGGIPEPPTQAESSVFRNVWKSLEPIGLARPCVWCTSPMLQVVPGQMPPQQGETLQHKKSDAVVYYALRTQEAAYGGASYLPFHEAWARGFWFPIPNVHQDGAGREEQEK